MARLPTVLTAIALLLSSVAFGGEAAQPAGPTGTLRFRLNSDPSTLDWNLAATSFESYIIMNLMEGLVEVGMDLKPKPRLAERWDISEDGRTYTFHLRKGVKWSDGKPLRASDFVDSWIRLLDPKTKSSYASYLFDVDNAEDFHLGKKTANQVGVKALGDHAFQVKLKQVVPYFVYLPSFWVTFPIRSDLIKKHKGKWTDPAHLATLGPYRLKSWKHGESLLLERNATYFGNDLGEKPSIAKVEALIETDEKKARESFSQGKLDFLLGVNTQDLLKARTQGKEIRTEHFAYLATFYLAFKVNTPALKNVDVRKAIALGIDRGEIPAALQGGQIPAAGWIPPGIDGFGSGTHLSGTLYQARGLLQKAGYAEGAKFPKLKMLVPKFDGSEALAKYLAESLKERLGIEVETKPALSSEYLRLRRTEDVDLVIALWAADYPDPSTFLEVFDSASGNNWTGWRNADYDRLLKEARRTLDTSSRIAFYNTAEKILLQKDVVILPLFYQKNSALIGPRVRKLELSPLNYLFLKNTTLK